jgi:hypothetical protein
LCATEHGDKIVPLYRAVAKAELDDIAQVGFRQHPGGRSLESKLFATSLENAARFGQDNFRFDKVPFHLIEVRVPAAIVDQFERVMLDFKPAVHVARELLTLLNRHAMVREITPIPLR